MPLDEDSVAFFSTLFRDEPAESEPSETDDQDHPEADVPTSVRPSTRRPASVPGGEAVAADAEDSGPRTAIMSPPQVLSSWESVPASPNRQTPASPPTPGKKDPPRGPRKRSRALAIGAVTLILAMVFGTGFLASNLGRTTVPSPSATQPTTGTPTAFPPAGTVLCSADVARNTTTSCEFASNVAIAVRQAGDVDPLSVSAYSPVTKRSYSLTCQRGAWIACTGGANAVVYVRSS